MVVLLPRLLVFDVKITGCINLFNCQMLFTRLSLFRGGSSTLQAVAVSNFVYFYTFHGLKKMAGIQGKQSAVKDLISACIAGNFECIVNFFSIQKFKT
jgi:hypothetical protein